MSNLMRWSGVDIADPIRRFLEGETGSWLRVEEYRDGDSMVVKAEVPGIDPGKVRHHPERGRSTHQRPARGKDRAQGQARIPLRGTQWLRVRPAAGTGKSSPHARWTGPYR